jgi:hypothetical protein
MSHSIDWPAGVKAFKPILNKDMHTLLGLPTRLQVQLYSSKLDALSPAPPTFFSLSRVESPSRCHVSFSLSQLLQVFTRTILSAINSVSNPFALPLDSWEGEIIQGCANARTYYIQTSENLAIKLQHRRNCYWQIQDMMLSIDSPTLRQCISRRVVSK